MNKKETIKRREVGSIAFYLIIAILALLVGAIRFFPNVMSHVVKHSSYVVISDSMTPVINVNDLIVVKRVAPETLKVNDIVTFDVDIDGDGTLELVTHYIAEIDGNNYRTKPNVSETMDAWTIHGNQIRGEVVMIIPKVGHLLIPLYNNAVPILLVALTAIVLTIVHVYYEKDEDSPKDDLDTLRV
ncbi:S26 family signal peptidase [Erysipelothrix anatis]|uniref:S26 family signal peptidase n=1 Tax=Erysipelothrix anatis TaxID=2683713 RepID=UPI00135B9591|nr:S26 family signal peptidase [Erysipelothrix anatis]